MMTNTLSPVIDQVSTAAEKDSKISIVERLSTRVPEQVQPLLQAANPLLSYEASIASSHVKLLRLSDQLVLCHLRLLQLLLKFPNCAQLLKPHMLEGIFHEKNLIRILIAPCSTLPLTS